MADSTQGSYADVRTYGIHNDRLQRKTYYVESGSVGIAATLEVSHPDYATEGGFPVLGATVYTHDGGMSTAAVATHVTSDGDTLVLDIKNPHEQDIISQDQPEYTTVTHVLAGVTGGSATPAQIVASLNADAAFYALAFATVTATNVVTLFPRGSEGHIRMGVGSTSILRNAFGTALPNDERTFVQEDPTEWLITFTPVDGKVSVANGTGAAVAKVIAAVSFY